MRCMVMKTLKSFLFTTLVLSLLSILLACDSNVSAPELNPSIDPSLLSIRVGALESGNKVYVRIPVDIFGSVDSLDGANIDLYKNGGLVISNLNAMDYYQEDQNDVGFYVSTMSAGVVIGFDIELESGSTLYYEGTVSAEEETNATVSVLPDPSVNTDVADFFDAQSAVSGNATEDLFSGTYSVSLIYSYSADCDSDFVAQTEFAGSGLSSDEIDLILAVGEIKSFEIQLSQTDGDLTWNNLDAAEDDYAGVVNSDGSFTIFDGDYVNENNYTYVLISGQIDSEALTITGAITRKLVLDGTQLVMDAAGSCTASGQMD